MNPPDSIGLRSLLLDVLAMAAIAALGTLAYTALAQTVLHDHDVYGVVRGYVRGVPAFHQHPFNSPSLYRLADLLGSPDMLAHDRLQRACAVVMACTLSVFYAAARTWGQRRRPALITTALIGCTPGVLYFGTVVELVPFGLFAAACVFWGFLALERFFAESSRALFCAAMLGVISATGAMTHATLHLLVLVLAGYQLTGFTQATARPLIRRTLGMRVLVTVVFVGVHAGVFMLYNLATGDGIATAERQTAYVAIGSQDLYAAAGRFGSVTWFEWFWPMAPISVLVLVPLIPWLPQCTDQRATARVRATVVLTLLAVLGYLVVSAVVLVDPTGTVPVVYERGAYLLPMVFPVAVFVTSFCNLRMCLPILFVAGVLAMIQRDHPDKEWPDEAFAESALAVRIAAPAHFLVAMYEEYDPLFRREPLLGLWGVGEIVQSTRARKADFTTAELALWFDYNVSELRRQHGRFLITERALQEFRDYRSGFAWLANTHIPSAYELKPVHCGAFHGFDLVPLK